MPRTRSMTSIDEEITKIRSELERIEKRKETLTAKLSELEKKKLEHDTKQIMDAYRRSGKSMEEVLTFFDV